MSPQKRRSLADDDAAAFVFGDAPLEAEVMPAPPTAPQPPPKSTKRKQTTAKRSPAKAKGKQGRAIDELMQSAEQERQVRITVDLAASQHQGLTLACAKLGKTKAEIIRALVDDFLDEVNQ